MAAKQKNISVSAPCRVDFAGGTVDLWPLYLYLGGLELVQMGIAVRAKTEISFTPAKKGHEILVESADLHCSEKYSSLESLGRSLEKNTKEVPLRWVNRLLYHYLKGKGSHGAWHIRTSSGAPPGSGLGGSSVLGISIARALETTLYPSAKRSAPWDMQMTVRDLEAIEIEHPAGDQDYVPALFGGLLILHMGPNFRKIERLPTDTAEELSSRCALIYTGKPHHSGINNWQVFTAYHKPDPKVRKALLGIKNVAAEFAEDLRQERLENLPELLNEESRLRKQLAPAVWAPVLERAWKFAKSHGAIAAKACGSGGGGCLLVMFKDKKSCAWAQEQLLPNPAWRWLSSAVAR